MRKYTEFAKFALLILFFIVIVPFFAFRPGAATVFQIIDNFDPGYSETGSWSSSQSCASTSYGLNGRFASNGGGTKTARWSFTVSTAGSYTVYISWIMSPFQATNASYTIAYEGGSAVRVINQTGTSCQWSNFVLQGTYRFVPGSTYSITLTNQGATGNIFADAVKVELAVADPSPTPTATVTPTFTSTPTPTSTPTMTPTHTPSPTATSTPTSTPTSIPPSMPTSTPTTIPTTTPTDIPVATSSGDIITPTITPTATSAPGPSATPTTVIGPSATPTAFPTATSTPVPLIAESSQDSSSEPSSTTEQPATPSVTPKETGQIEGENTRFLSQAKPAPYSFAFIVMGISISQVFLIRRRRRSLRE